MNLVNTTYTSTEDMINILQSLKRKTKLKFYKNVSNYYDEMIRKKVQTQEDPFSKIAQGISKIFQEVLLLKKLLQTKPQVKNMYNKYYDLYYTVIKTRNEKQKVNDEFQNYENDFISLNDVIIPNHYDEIKGRGK